MLEIESHRYLKKFVSKSKLDWEHIFSFGRILSISLRKKDNYLINSEIFKTNKWIPALLISLCLNPNDTFCILTEENFQFIISSYLSEIKKLGFDFTKVDNQLIFKTHKIIFISYQDLIHRKFNFLNLQKKSFIFTDSENFKNNLKEASRLSLLKNDWFNSIPLDSKSNDELKSTYNLLKKKFFLKSISNRNKIFLDEIDIKTLIHIFTKYSHISKQFLHIKIALLADWACWAVLDNEKFEWALKIEPVDPISLVEPLAKGNHFIFLSSLRENYFLQKYLKNANLEINLTVNLKSDFREKDILIYVPKRQLLPNNPLFVQSVFDKCNKIFLLSRGNTVILSNEINLKNEIATKLASIYGKKILLEEIPNIKNKNYVICASFDWWIHNLHLITIPDKIIIPLLPIPDMSEPINQITASFNKKLSKDWFRDFMIPDTFEKLDKSVAPLRINSGKLFFLDGRVNYRKWGRDIIEMIRPSKYIHQLIPFE